MNRLDIINYLAKINDAQNYLEIGVRDGLTFSQVNIPNKIGVDPDPKSKATLFLKSDIFFNQNQQKFDIIFIDGLHHAEQVEKDINNSLQVLNPNGYIVCHDMLPTSKKMQRIPQRTVEWTGDCWKAWVKLRTQRKDLSMYLVNIDYGCGIIFYGSQNLIRVRKRLKFKNLQKYKYDWMNIITLEEFYRIFQ